MTCRVWDRDAQYNNSEDVAASPVKSLAKLAYYHCLAIVYGVVGSFAQVGRGGSCRAGLGLVGVGWGWLQWVYGCQCGGCGSRGASWQQPWLVLTIPSWPSVPCSVLSALSCPCVYHCNCPASSPHVPCPAAPTGGDGEQQLDAAAHQRAVVVVA